MTTPLTTDRLVVRDWTSDDAEAAHAIYGAEDVTHWLTPAMDRVGDVAAMRSVLHAWQEAQPNLPPPRGRWAIERREDGVVVGGLGIHLLPPFEEDLELSWQLSPDAWGQGFAALIGAVLFLPPLLSAAARASAVFGLPAIWVYLFVAWALLIGLVAVLVRRPG